MQIDWDAVVLIVIVLAATAIAITAMITGAEL